MNFFFLFLLKDEEDTSFEDIVQFYQIPEVKKKMVLARVGPNDVSPEKSPVIINRSNPFKKSDDDSNDLSPSLLNRSRTRRVALSSRFKSTVIDNTAVKQSKFFTKNDDKSLVINDDEDLGVERLINNKKKFIEESMDVNVNSSQDYKENIKKNCYTIAGNDFKDDSIVIPDTETFIDNNNFNNNTESGVIIPETELFDHSMDCDKQTIILPETEPSDDENIAIKSSVSILYYNIIML